VYAIVASMALQAHPTTTSISHKNQRTPGLTPRTHQHAQNYQLDFGRLLSGLVWGDPDLPGTRSTTEWRKYPVLKTVISKRLITLGAVYRAVYRAFVQSSQNGFTKPFRPNKFVIESKTTSLCFFPLQLDSGKGVFGILYCQGLYPPPQGAPGGGGDKISTTSVMARNNPNDIYILSLVCVRRFSQYGRLYALLSPRRDLDHILGVRFGAADSLDV
jgi:hypothetical protein